MREKALVNLTAELVGRVLSATQVLTGAWFVQALAEMSAAGVTARSRGDSRTATPQDAPGPTAAAVAGEAVQPFFELSEQQQLQLLSDVARVLPLLQPPQLPLLVNSMMRLQLSPGAAWLSDILHALAVKAAAAAAAGQPAQQLLLLAAAKQLLVCGGAMLAPSAASGVPAAGSAAVVGYAQSEQTVPASLGGRSPVAFAFRSLAAGAAQVLGSVFRRARDQHSSSGSNLSSGQPHGALAAAAAVAAAMSDVPTEGDSSVALLLSSLATQLQLAQAAPGAAASATALSQAQQTDSTARAAAMLQALQARRAAQAGRAGSPERGDAQKQQRQLLAAAVLLHAGSGAPAALSAGAGDGSRPLRVMTSAAGAEGAWDGAWHGLDGTERKRQEAQQQQQQRVLLGQLLRLQLQKASGQLVQAVWGQQGQQEAQQSAADVYATQVLLDPTGGLLNSTQQQQQQPRTPDSGQVQQQQRVRPHRLVTQGLQVQFDGLLRKAFMAAAAAAAPAAGRHSPTQAGDEASSGMQTAVRREPWWLPKAPRDVAGLLQANADDFGSSSPGINSANGTDGLGSEAVPALEAGGLGQSLGRDSIGEGGCQVGGSGGPDGREPVVVLPVMSRALDAQFARLMREVLHSSLAAGGSSRSSA